MVGSLLLSVDQMSQEAASSPSTREAWHAAVEHLGHDVAQASALVLAKKNAATTHDKTEMYGTLLVHASCTDPTTASPSTRDSSYVLQHVYHPRHAASPTENPSKVRYWNPGPIDDVSIYELHHFRFVFDFVHLQD